MKNLTLFLSCLLIGTTTLFVSCDKKDDPTPEKEEKVNKDLVLEYSLTFANSEIIDYDSKQVELDLNTIAAYLGVDKEQLGSALTGKEKSDITCLAINNSTNSDTIRSNTQYHWGHWWEKNGDVCEKYNGMFQSAFTYEEGIGIFNIYLNYDRYEVCQTKITEALRYQGKCVKIVFTISVIDLNDKQHIVATNSMSVDYLVTSQSQQVTVDDFNAEATLSALGANSWDDVIWLVKGESGYKTVYVSTVTKEPCYYYDENGDYTSSLLESVIYATVLEGQLSIQQMGTEVKPNGTMTIKFYMLYNNKIVENSVTINFVDYLDPETAPEGSPASIEKDLSVTFPRNDWESTSIDITEDLRQCFKMTTYQVHKAINNNEIKIWYGEVGKGEYNSGFYIDTEGNVVSASDFFSVFSSIIASLTINSAENNIAISLTTISATSNQDITTITPKLILEKDDVTATFNITINIKDVE
ncbi:MAG: DUF4859 domain-containing protein [Bacteroidales bacterium]|nr:DUF4859 domain-containing protein [Bacteroidales bacterium]